MAKRGGSGGGVWRTAWRGRSARRNGARGRLRSEVGALERRGVRFSSAASPLRPPGGALAPSRDAGPLVHPAGLWVASMPREGGEIRGCGRRATGRLRATLRLIFFLTRAEPERRPQSAACAAADLSGACRPCRYVALRRRPSRCPQGRNPSKSELRPTHLTKLPYEASKVSSAG